MESERLAVSSQQLAKVYPFHLAVDSSMRVVQAGDALCRLCPGLEQGAAFNDVFQLTTPIAPDEYAALAEHAHESFVLEHRQAGLRLQGQLVVDADTSILLFLGSPWLAGISELQSLALALKDTATLPDPVAEFLFMMQTQRATLTGAERMTMRLLRQAEELRQANRKLAAQHAVTEILSEAASLETAAPGLLHAICVTLNWECGALWLIDEGERELRCEAVWVRTGLDLQDFELISLTTSYSLPII